MPPDYTHMRRQDRAKDEAWIKAFLRRAPVCVLATEWQGQPFAKPTLFAYDEPRHAIYFHTALEGRTRANIEANSRVCLCAYEMGRLLPADTAMEVGLEYGSVMVFGQVFVVSDEDEARHGLQRLLDKYFPHLKPGEDYRQIIPEEIAITAVYRLDIQQWSGKEERAAADFPGAFSYQSEVA